MPQQHQAAIDAMNAETVRRQQQASQPPTPPPAPPPQPQDQNLFSMIQGLRGPLTPEEQSGVRRSDVSDLLSQAQHGAQQGMTAMFGPSIFAGNMPNPYSSDPRERGAFMNALAMSAGFSPLRVGIDPMKDVPGKILDLLKNTQFDPLEHNQNVQGLGQGFYSGAPAQGRLANMETIQGPSEFFRKQMKSPPPMEMYFVGHERDEAKKYLEAIDAWKRGYSGMIRRAGSGLDQARGFPGEYAENTAQMYDRLTELANRADYASKGPMYRFSEMMGEFPKDIITKDVGSGVKVPKEGSVFYQGPASYSASPQWPRNSSWMTKQSPLIMVDPGAKTLPMGGMLNYPEQHEHMIGGLMKVIESSPQVVRLRQLGPIVPRKP